MTQKNRPRHPEKIKNPISPIKKKPDWIRSKLSNSKEFFLTKTIVNKNNLVTVCQEANCPNITECWSKRHATFMIMGDTCTRACAFCDVKTGKPIKLDELEAIKISQAHSRVVSIQSHMIIFPAGTYQSRTYLIFTSFTMGRPIMSRVMSLRSVLL